MKIRNLLPLVAILVGTSSFAIERVQTFATKDECLRQFTLSSGSSNAVAGENFCKDKIVKSAIDICTDKKLLNFKMMNSISSVDEPKYAQKFKNDCLKEAQVAASQSQPSAVPVTSGQVSIQQNQATQQQASAAEAQQQAAAKAQQQQAAAAAAKQNQGSGQQQSGFADAASLVQAVVPIAEKVEKTYDAAKAAEAKTAVGSVSATTVGVTEKSTSDTFKDNSGNIYQVNTDVDGKQYIEKTDSSDQITNVEKLPIDAKPVSQISPADVSKVGKLGTSAGDAAKGVEAAAKTPSDAAAPATEITTATNTKSSETEQQFTQVKSIVDGMNSSLFPYNITVAAITEAKIKLDSVLALKKTCAKLAETSGFLCIEGTSPGAKATKTLVDVAGPILAVVNSAQKACSNTASVTGLAAKALTIAKGTCMAAKLACDGGCAIANAKLKELQATVQSLYGKVNTDWSNVNAECNSFAPSPTVAPCLEANQEKYKAHLDQLKNLVKILADETPPTLGTASYAAAKCTTNIQDIALMALNIGGLVMAKKSADECDKKLAAAGAAGGAVTATQYCETPANVSTQFCKCQKNSQQDGCPGFTASADKDKVKEMAGINSKTVGGLSNFAGGTNGSLNSDPKSAFDSNSRDSTSDASKLGLSGNGGSSAGGYGAAGASGSNGSRASDSAADDKSDGQQPENKKWSFGAFASSIGGLFGGGKNSKNFGNGNLNTKQEAAIKRKLASDKLASEVTSASGKSNWEKVHQVYLIKDKTLLSGQ